MAYFLAFLKAIPALINLMMEVGKFLKENFGDNPAKYLADSGEAFKKLNEAKTSEEKIHAAQELQKLLNRM